MDKSFKSLPPKLFRNLNSEATRSETTQSSSSHKAGILWLPPLHKSNITVKLDWLSGMQISRLEFSKSRKWPTEIKDCVTQFNLVLDEEPPFKHHNTLIFSLPKGMKSSLGLIINNSSWNDREEVYNRYSTACESFKNNFFIQSLDIWNSPKTPHIEWIKV